MNKGDNNSSINTTPFRIVNPQTKNKVVATAWCPVNIAAIGERAECLKILVDNGAEVSDETLSFCLHSSQLDCLTAALSSPQFSAAETAPVMVTVLVQRGRHLFQEEESSGASSCGDRASTAQLRTLVAAGVQLMCTEFDLLDCIVHNRSLERVSTLLAAGVRYGGLRDHQGFTAAQRALFLGSRRALDCYSSLCDSGANPDWFHGAKDARALPRARAPPLGPR